MTESCLIWNKVNVTDCFSTNKRFPGSVIKLQSVIKLPPLLRGVYDSIWPQQRVLCRGIRSITLHFQILLKDIKGYFTTTAWLYPGAFMQVKIRKVQKLQRSPDFNRKYNNSGIQQQEIEILSVTEFGFSNLSWENSLLKQINTSKSNFVGGYLWHRSVDGVFVHMGRLVD